MYSASGHAPTRPINLVYTTDKISHLDNHLSAGIPRAVKEADCTYQQKPSNESQEQNLLPRLSIMRQASAFRFFFRTARTFTAGCADAEAACASPFWLVSAAETLGGNAGFLTATEP